MAAAGVVPGLDPLEDRRGELGPGWPRCGGRGARAASSTRTTRSSRCRRWRRRGPSSRAARRARSRCPKTQDVYCDAAVRVDDRARAGAALPARHLQGVDDELGADVVGDRPADDPSGEHVDDGAAVDPAVAARCWVMSVNHSRSGASATNWRLTRSSWVAGVGLPVPVLALVADPAQARGPHQPGDPLAPAHHAQPSRSSACTRGTRRCRASRGGPALIVATSCVVGDLTRRRAGRPRHS